MSGVLAELTRLQKRYLARRECTWCHQRLDRDGCGSRYEQCSSDAQETRRRRALAFYTPMTPINPRARPDGAAEAQGERQAGWNIAVRWLRERASSHSGRWMTMDPREAIKATADEMETLHVSRK